MKMHGFILLAALSLPTTATRAQDSGPKPTPKPPSKISKFTKDVGTMIAWMLGSDRAPVNSEKPAPSNPPVMKKPSKPDLSTPQKLYDFYQSIIFDGRAKEAFSIYDDKKELQTDFNLFMEYYRTNKPAPSNYPWIVSQFPSLEVRLDYFYNQTLKLGKDEMIGKTVLQYDNSFVKIDSREKLLEFIHNKGRKYSYHFFNSRKPKEIPEPPENLTHTSFNDSATNPTLQWLACARLAKLDANKCLKALQGIIQYMTPVGYVTALPAIKEVLTNWQYADGAAIAANKIVNKVDSITDLNATYEFGDLFTDIRESYIEAGVAAAEAEEMTWTLLMVYSSRGANIHMLDPFASNIYAVRTLTSLKVISMGISVLDAATHKSGQYYSLPKGIRSTANYAKVYHFWMAAALARMMAKQYGDAFASMMAAVIVEIGYQMFSGTGGREHLLLETLKDSAYGMEANKARMDMGFGFAGAAYGGYVTKNPLARIEIDLDQVMRAAINKARDYRSLDPVEAANLVSQIAQLGAMKKDWTMSRIYVRYLQFIRPLGILSAVKSQIFCNWIFGGLKTPAKKP